MARTATAEPTAETAGVKTLKDVDVSDVPADNPESVDLAKAIERANNLIEQKRVVLGELQEARQYCDLSVKNGIGSPEQVRWVRFYLPRKSRNKSDSDNGVAASEDA